MNRPRHKLMATCIAATTLAGLALTHSSVAASGAETALHIAFSGTTNYPEQWVDGTGYFAFSTGAPLGCTAVGTMGGQPVAGTCTMSASGTFTSVACGTASALGTATISTSAGSFTLDLGIDTSGFVGVVIPAEWNQTYSIEGVVQISPNSAQLPLDWQGQLDFATPCTFGFTVSGDVTVVQLPAVTGG
jgi:hypothetical protein